MLGLSAGADWQIYIRRGLIANMIAILKRRRLLFGCILLTLLFCLGGVMNNFINGQAIAGSHLDGLLVAPVYMMVAVFFAVLIAVVQVVRFLLNRERRSSFLWFLIPTIFAAVAPIHNFIADIFPCCPPDGIGVIPTIGETLVVGISSIVIAIGAFVLFFVASRQVDKA
jgi:hypothetical protein